ncbi:hypothetical protein RND81_14G156800 [Saponaria officinalis]|uniref:Uncharacterized protein n=1 Tax=Saponaria officinalis TaxID=3572 RepID=A0AAW1GQ80_SAPOF
MIVKCFEHNSYMFRATNTKEFLLSKYDAYDVFCLPKEGDKVQLTATEHSKHNGIKMNELADRLKGFRESGDEFKKMFVVYSMSSFLAPAANYLVDFKLLRAVKDVNRIRHIDWCSYIFDQVVESVRKVKKGNTFLCGCTLFLIISYFHRIEYRGKVLPHSIPLIKHWTDEMFNDRAKAESNTGCLGSGPVTRIIFPIYNEVDDGDLEVEHNQGDEQVVEDDGDLGEEDNQRDKENVEDDGDLRGENNQRDEQNVEDDGDLGGENNEGVNRLLKRTWISVDVMKKVLERMM